MVYLQMGVQTGSERIRKMYKRPFSNEEVISIADMLAKYVPRILPPRYDIIKEQVYRKQLFHKRRSYLNFVPGPFNTPAPKIVMQLLITKPALLIFNRPYFGRLLRLAVKD